MKQIRELLLPKDRSAFAVRCRRKFLRLFPSAYRSLCQKGNFTEIAARAIRIESRINLLFSFEKMALRDAHKSRSRRGMCFSNRTPCGLQLASTVESSSMRLARPGSLSKVFLSFLAPYGATCTICGLET